MLLSAGTARQYYFIDDASIFAASFASYAFADFRRYGRRCYGCFLIRFLFTIFSSFDMLITRHYVSITSEYYYAGLCSMPTYAHYAYAALLPY